LIRSGVVSGEGKREEEKNAERSEAPLSQGGGKRGGESRSGRVGNKRKKRWEKDFETENYNRDRKAPAS